LYRNRGALTFEASLSLFCEFLVVRNLLLVRDVGWGDVPVMKEGGTEVTEVEAHTAQSEGRNFCVERGG